MRRVRAPPIQNPTKHTQGQKPYKILSLGGAPSKRNAAKYHTNEKHLRDSCRKSNLSGVGPTGRCAAGHGGRCLFRQITVLRNALNRIERILCYTRQPHLPHSKILTYIILQLSTVFKSDSGLPTYQTVHYHCCFELANCPLQLSAAEQTAYVIQETCKSRANLNTVPSLFHHHRRNIYYQIRAHRHTGELCDLESIAQSQAKPRGRSLLFHRQHRCSKRS